MGELKTFVLGRSGDADISVQDGSVSRLHAELTISKDKRLFITDRVSANGTMVYRGGTWKNVRQDFINSSETLRFGDMETTCIELMDELARLAGSQNVKGEDEIPKGPMKRDPGTGEIIQGGEG